MSQRNVEIVIGRLTTDEDLRRRFARDSSRVLDEFLAEGLQLTRTERDALLAIDVSACERFADRVDPRLVKVCLRRRDEP